MSRGNIFFSRNDTFLRKISVSYKFVRQYLVMYQEKRSTNHLVIQQHIFRFSSKRLLHLRKNKNNWQIFSLMAVSAIQFYYKVAGNKKMTKWPFSYFISEMNLLELWNTIYMILLNGQWVCIMIPLSRLINLSDKF